ncbi:MAG: nitrous oxide reductase accessory protein NosL [Caldilineales bacterium]|nr:nitrous oxide reductase accessory protein NosL [Caldilineales bacterium]
METRIVTRRIELQLLIWLTVALLIAISAATLTACAQGQTTAQPPEIRYGESVCAQCNMIISDERFASGYAYEISPGRYESLAFDDIGDMLASAAAHPERNVTNWYVHDYTSKEWLDATQAHYVFSENLSTPMGHGVAALADRSAAQTLAAELSGEALSWQELMARHKSGMLAEHMSDSAGSSMDHAQ